MCALYVEIMCADRFGLGWAHDAYIVACHMFMYFLCMHTILLLFWYWYCLVLFCLSLSFSLSLSHSLIVCTWHPSAKLLHLGTLFVPRHHLLLILAFFMSGSVIIKPVRTFPRTFLGVAFTRNARSFFLTSPILTFPLSFTIGVRGPFVISRLVVPPWSYKNFTLICTNLILPYLAFSFLFEVYIQ